jgi:hypothetical protein
MLESTPWQTSTHPYGTPNGSIVAVKHTTVQASITAAQQVCSWSQPCAHSWHVMHAPFRPLADFNTDVEHTTVQASLAVAW